MKGVVVIGAGKIGATVAGLLASTGDYQVTLSKASGLLCLTMRYFQVLTSSAKQ